MALVFAIMCLCNIFFSFFKLFFFLVWINPTEWSTIPACPSLMCSFNRGNTEGTNSLEKMCLLFVYTCMFCFMFV